VSARRSLTRHLPALATVVLLAAAATADAATKSYSTYLGEMRPVVHQWWQGLENWQGVHFLTEPLASNTENAAEVNQLLRQWWDGLEARRGTHFLSEPVGSNTDATGELHQLLNQWQNALEAWRGTHFLQEPPSPLTISSISTKTGEFGLTPTRAEVMAGDRFSYQIGWKVPRPNNWHDLRTIDLRVCGKGGVLWVRWTELGNTLSLLNPTTGRVIAKGPVGERRRLKSPNAVLALGASSVTGSGETGRSMTLELALTFRPPTEGVECGVKLAAKDDLGNRDGFKRAGRIEIRSG
jgi:hypothetical protein